MPRGKRQVRNFGFLSPNKRTEKLAVLRELFALDAMSEVNEEESSGGGDALSHSDDEQEPIERICPLCEVGKMILRRKVPRPTVHAIMQWTADDLRQLRLDFR